MEIPFEIGINFFQACLMIFFMNHRLHKKKECFFPTIICLLGITGFYTMYLFADVDNIPDILVFFIPLFYGFWCAKDPWYITTFWTFVLMLLVNCVAACCFHLYTLIYQEPYENLMIFGWRRVLFVISANVVLGFFIWMIRYIRRDYTRTYLPALFLFLLVIGILLVVEESVYSVQLTIEPEQETVNSDSFLCANIGILAAVAVTILLFHFLSRSGENESKYKMEIAAIDRAKSYTKELELMYERLGMLKHDLKHHYQVIGEMAERGLHQEARDYVDSLENEIDQSCFHWTGSKSVDALILAKSMMMEQYQIQFELDPYPLGSLPISDSNFCAVLGNILDNAIEGACRVVNEHKKIQLSFSKSGDMLYLYCVNTCNEKTIHRDRHGWRSSKENDGISAHAIGIRSVERIVREADGRCDFSVANGLFSVRIVLPFESTTEKVLSSAP